MKRFALALILIAATLPIFPQTPLSFPLEGEVEDLFMDDIDGDGRLDFLFGTWDYLENPSLLYWWQFFWERGTVSFYSADRRVFKYHTGAFINSVSVVDFGERLIAAGTTLLEGRPSGYVLFFSLDGDERGVFRTDGKVRKVLALDSGKKLLVLNFREAEDETQFLIIGKNGLIHSFIISDLIGEVRETDLEGDGKRELLAGSVFDKTIPHYVYLFDQNFKELIRIETDDLVESLDAADLDGDGLKEIIVGTYNYVYAFKKDGSLLWRHELPVGPVHALRTADLSGDGTAETLFSSHAALFVLNNAGSLVSEKELPFEADYLFVKDWDGDGKEEIIVSDGAHFAALKMSDLPIVETAPPPASPQPASQPASAQAAPTTEAPSSTQVPQSTSPPSMTFFPSSIRICEANPVSEAITLCNNGAAPVDIGGWTLSDNSGFYTIPAHTIILSSGSWSVDISAYNPTRGENGLLLDDAGDYLELRDTNGNLVDRKTWGTHFLKAAPL